jgi:hypothetical protein
MPAVAVLVGDRADVRGDEHARIGPQALRRGALELADVDVEGGAAQMAALEGLGERILVHDLPATNSRHASGICEAAPWRRRPYPLSPLAALAGRGLG